MPFSVIPTKGKISHDLSSPIAISTWATCWSLRVKWIGIWSWIAPSKSTQHPIKSPRYANGPREKSVCRITKKVQFAAWTTSCIINLIFPLKFCIVFFNFSWDNWGLRLCHKDPCIFFHDTVYPVYTMAHSTLVFFHLKSTLSPNLQRKREITGKFQE